MSQSVLVCVLVAAAAVAASPPSSHSMRKSNKVTLGDPVLAGLRDATSEVLQKAKEVQAESQQHASSHGQEMEQLLATKKDALQRAAKHAEYIKAAMSAHRSATAARDEQDEQELKGTSPKALAKAAHEAEKAALAATALQTRVQSQLKRAEEGSDKAAAAVEKAEQREESTQNALKEELDNAGISESQLHATSGEDSLTQALEKQRETMREVKSEKAKISSKLDIAEQALIGALQRAAEEPSKTTQAAAQVAAVEHHMLEKEEEMASNTENRIATAEQHIRDRLKRTEVQGMLMDEQVRGNIGPKVVKLIGDRAAAVLTAEDLVTEAKEHEEQLEAARHRIEATAQVIEPLVDSATNLKSPLTPQAKQKQEEQEEAEEAKEVAAEAALEEAKAAKAKAAIPQA